MTYPSTTSPSPNVAGTTPTEPKDALAHIIRNAHDELDRITLSDTDASMAEAEGRSVTTNASAMEIMDEIGPMPANEYMDEKTWTAIAPGLKALADYHESHPTQYHRQPATMPLTSPDLPDAIIPLRMDALGAIYNEKLDLAAYIELNELAFARAESRGANQNLFRDGSWEEDWTAIYQEDVDILNQQADSLSEMISEHQSEAAAFGDAPPGSGRQDALGRLQIAEIDYAIKTYFGDEPDEAKPDNGFNDIPY